MRSLPHASFTAQARITNCRRSRDFKVSRHSTLARGAAQATESQRVRTGQKGGFSRHAEIFSGTTSSIAVAHAINTNADEHGPPAPVVPPLALLIHRFWKKSDGCGGKPQFDSWF